MKIAFISASALLDEIYPSEFEDVDDDDDTFEDYEQEEDGTEEVSAEAEEQPSETMCSICFEEYSDELTCIELPYCKHRFCSDCLTGFASLELAQAKAIDFQFLRTNKIIQREDNTNEFVQTVLHGVKCPATSCKSLIPRTLMVPNSIQSTKSPYIYIEKPLLARYDKLIQQKCMMGCGLENHSGSCASYRQSMLNNAMADVLFGVYALGLKNSLRPCPYCGSPVEKNGGCSHMKCIRCQKDYDWNKCCLLVDSKTSWSATVQKSIRALPLGKEDRTILSSLNSLSHTVAVRSGHRRTGRRKGARRRGMILLASPLDRTALYRNQLIRVYQAVELLVEK